MSAYDVVPIEGLPGETQTYSGERKSLDLVSNGLPAYTNYEGVLLELAKIQCWLADPAALAAFNGVKSTVMPLPTLNNIAIVQAELAFNRLSLARASKEAEESMQAHDVDRHMLAVFPYEQVKPLYLQGPSITLKSKA